MRRCPKIVCPLVVRENMHPADQFEAFAAMIGEGASVATVTARFGVTQNTVTRRMKLGRLAPANMSN
jgi:ParB family chromosome partitioning protein